MTASAVRVAANLAEMAAEVVAMAAGASAARAQQAKSVRHARVDAVVKAGSKAVKAKPVPHAVSVPNAASAQNVANAVSAASAPTVIALPVRAVVMAVQAHAVTTWLKASAPTA